MNEVAVKLQALQATDPGNKKLNTINSKYTQLQRKVMQITPVAASPAPPPKPESGPGTAAPPDKGHGSTDQAISGIAIIAMAGMTGHLDRAVGTGQKNQGGAIGLSPLWMFWN